MTSTLLLDVMIVFGLSVAVLTVFLRFRLPVILGYIITGILAGPYGFGLVGATRQVDTIAEIGVVLLLFTIGIEFSLRSLIKIRRSVFIGGAFQSGLTILLTYSVCIAAGLDRTTSLFAGLVLSLSSTAIVLKLMEERGEIESAYGRTTLAVLIFQDLLVVPFMILTPYLAGTGGSAEDAMLVIPLKGLILIAVLFLAYKLVPWVLYRVARTRSRELFLMSIILICFSIAWLTYETGFSLALGAFLAGLIISESEYSHEALGRILPFRDVFVSFFFISIGMLLDVNFLVAHPWMVAAAAFFVIVLKMFTAGLSVMVLGYPLKIAVMSGFALSQIGEFSLILSKAGMDYGIINSSGYQMLLAVTLITMAMTPFVMNLAPHAAAVCERFPVPERVAKRFDSFEDTVFDEKSSQFSGHLVIVGFGVNGRNVSHAASMAGVPYVILELNPDTVRNEREKGTPIFYGDATQEAILRHARIASSRIMVIAIPDAPSTRSIVSLARKMNPDVHIIARTRFVSEVVPLFELGADEVVPEEFETSIEIFSRVLAGYFIPADDIERFARELRAGGYSVLRRNRFDSATLHDLSQELSGLRISTLRIHPGSMCSNRKLADFGMRKNHKVTALAIRRAGDVLLNPGADDVLRPYDEVIVAGNTEDINRIKPMFRAKENSLPG